MKLLVAVVCQLSRARDLSSVMRIVRVAARELTGADGATFVLREGDQCYYYAEENAIGPLWKGRRFPMSACISGWVMLQGRSAVIEDIYADPRIPADAYRPTFVKSLAMVPIRRELPIGAIGNYWAKARQPTGAEVALLEALADTTSVALENAQLYTELQATIEMLRGQRARIQEQHAALEVFTRALAHDLREPVRTIRSFAASIAEGDLDEASKTELFEHIRAAGDRTAMLIEAIGLYTQLDDPQLLKKELVPLGEVAEAAQANLAELIGARRATVVIGTLPVVVASRTQLLQVLQNLLSNALSHGGEGVRVEVSARRDGDAWSLSVCDDGPGIAPEHHELIFQPFRRLERDDAHSGLGLAICRKIVEAHGGKIACASEPGRGATFTFTLPAHEQLAEGTASPGTMCQKAAPPSDLATVLLVDDREADILLTRVRLLGRKGLQCKLLVAHDGREALDLIGSTRRQGAPVDLVLLDINMPGMDGFEMLERLRRDESLHDIPVVMHSGSTYEQDKERSRALGAVGYLEKPASLGKLRPIVDRLAGLRVIEASGGTTLVRQRVSAA